MPSSSHSTFQIWIQCILLFAVCASVQGQEATPQPTPRLEKPPLQYELTVGYCDYPMPVRTGMWLPVYAEVTAGLRDVKGTIQLRQGKNELQAQMPFEIAAGDTKLLRSFYRFDPNIFTLTMTLWIEDGRTEKFDYPLNFAGPREHQILILSETPGGFGFLNRNLTERQPYDANMQDSARTLYGEIHRLPEYAIALETLDAIVISTPAVREITKEQWNALREWMAFGGRLLLAAGRHQPFIARSELKKPFGIELGQPEACKAVTWASLSLGFDPALEFLVSPINAEPSDVMIGPPHAPLLVSRTVGMGEFHLLGTALDQEFVEFLNNDAQRLFFSDHDSMAPAALWRSLLERDRDQLGLAEAATIVLDSQSQSLQQNFRFQLVGPGWVIGFLGIYLVIAGPLNWWFFRRMDRRLWAWPAAAGLAVLFAAFGVWRGVSSQGQNRVLNEITVVTRPAADAVAHARTWSSLFVPKRLREDLRAPAGTFASGCAAVDWMSGGTYLYENEPLQAFWSPAAASIGGFFMHPWSVRSVRTDYTSANSRGIEVEGPIEILGTEPYFRGKILNRTGLNFTRWWVLNGRTFYAPRDDGWLAPDAAWDMGNMRSFLTNGRSADVLNFLWPELSTQQVTYSRGGQPFVSSPDLASTGIPELLSASSNKLLFIGEALVQAPSPYFRDFKNVEVTNRILYQQLMPTAIQALPERLIWNANFLEPIYSSDGGGRYIPLNGPVRIELRPEYWSGIDDSAAVRIQLKVTGKPSAAVQAYPGQRGFADQDNVRYEYIECPIRIFNRDARRFERSELGTGITTAFRPAARYFDRATGAILLELNLDSSVCKFRLWDRNGNPREDLGRRPNQMPVPGYGMLFFDTPNFLTIDVVRIEFFPTAAHSQRRHE